MDRYSEHSNEHKKKSSVPAIAVVFLGFIALHDLVAALKVGPFDLQDEHSLLMMSANVAAIILAFVTISWKKERTSSSLIIPLGIVIIVRFLAKNAGNWGLFSKDLRSVVFAK